MRSWDLRTGEDVQELALHRDYVLSMTARDHPGSGGGLLVTGGAADHLVILYDTDDSGSITCRHKLSGDERDIHRGRNYGGTIIPKGPITPQDTAAG